MNGASEATLQELLQTNKEMAAALQKLAGASSGGGGGGSTNPAKAAIGVGKAFETAGKAVGVSAGLFGAMLDPAIKAVSATMNMLVSSGKTLFANQMQLAEGAIAGSNSLASLTSGLEQLPGILGMAMKAYNYQIKVLEANLNTFQTLADTGATLGGSLTEVRNSAKGMYLSLDEFGRVMKANTGQLLNWGTTADDGARALIKFNTSMIKGDVGRQIMGMGYTAEQANNLLGLMSETMGGITADQLKDQRGMEKSVKSFAEELVLSAELEGKTRQQKEAEMKERAQDAVRENMLSKMSLEEKKAYIEAENRANMIGGKGARDALLAATMGLPPMTKEAQIFTATNQKANQSVLKMSDTVKDATLSETERQKRIQKAYGEGAQAAAENAKIYGTSGVAIAMGSGKYADAMRANLTAETNARKQNMQSAEDFIDRENKARANLAEAQEGEAGAVAQRQASIKYQGEELMNALFKAFKPLIDIILKANEVFLKYLPIATQFAADVINKGVGFLKDIFSKVDWGIVKNSFDSAWNMLSTTFGSIGDAVSKAFGGSKGMGNILQTALTDIFGAIGKIVDAGGFIVTKFASSDLFTQMKTFFGGMWDLLKNLVDAVVAIVKSPVGEFVIDAIFSVFEILFATMNILVDGISAATKIVGDVFKFISLDFNTAWEKIKDYASDTLDTVIGWFKSIPAKIGEIFSTDALSTIWDAVKSLLSSLADGIKNMGKALWNWVTGSEKPPAAPAAPATESVGAGTGRAKELGAVPVKTPAGEALSPSLKVESLSAAPQDMLIAQLQTLNNITNEMLRAIRDTRDYSKSTANILAANGNLFRRA